MSEREKLEQDEKWLRTQDQELDKAMQKQHEDALEHRQLLETIKSITVSDEAVQLDQQERIEELEAELEGYRIHAEIELRAYWIWRGREASGALGDAMSDWANAQSQSFSKAAAADERLSQ